MPIKVKNGIIFDNERILIHLFSFKEGYHQLWIFLFGLLDADLALVTEK